MSSFSNLAYPKLLLFSCLGIVAALAIALVSPVWLGNAEKTQAASIKSVTSQGILPTPTPAVSQGVAVHGTHAWRHDGYTGSTVKIGIIDWDFQGFTNLMGTELPANTPIITRVYAQCYTAAGMDNPTIADCEDPCTVNCESYVGHGTSVAEIIADVAPPTPTPTPDRGM